MTVELTPEKITKIKNLTKIRLNQRLKIRDFAKMVGCLVSCCPTVNYMAGCTQKTAKEQNIWHSKQSAMTTMQN